MRRVLSAAPTAALAFFVSFVVALLFMHVIRPDYTIVDHMISDYAVGPTGWIMTSAFVSLAFGCMALAIGMFGFGPKSWLGRTGASLLIVACVGLIVTALFPTDLETAPSTQTGTVHAISFLVNVVSILVSTLCLAFSYGGSAHWRTRRRPAVIFAGLLALAFVGQFLTLHRGAPYGITNRLFVAILMAWLVANSLWLKRVADGQRPHEQQTRVPQRRPGDRR